MIMEQPTINNKRRNRQDKSDVKKAKRMEVVDLTDESTSNISNDSHPVITLEDSIGPQAPGTRPEVIEVNDSDTDSTPEPIQLKPPLKQAKQPPPRTPETPPTAPKCPICIETYANVKKRGFKIVATRCGHVFCDFCLKTALAANGRKCPKCRKNIPRGPTGIIEIFDVC